MRKYSVFIIKTLLFFTIITIGYYFLYLVPQSKQPQKLRKAEKVLTKHHSNLVQNRIAYVELTRLEPDSANFDLERSDLVARLRQTRVHGLELLEEQLEARRK